MHQPFKDKWQFVLHCFCIQSSYENVQHWPLLRQYVHQPKGFTRGELVKVTADMCCTELLLAQHTLAHMNRWWGKPLSCRYLWQRTVWASFCTSATSVQGREAFQSTFCGRGVGMPRGLAWRWKDPVTSNWKISTQRRVSCLSLIMVCTSTARSEGGQKLIMSHVMDDSMKAWPLWFPGEGGVDGDGDITRPENITAFRNFVLESTEKRGLHFLMADGVRLFHNCRLIFVTILLLQSLKNLLTLYHTRDEFTESCTWWVEQRFSGFC